MWQAHFGTQLGLVQVLIVVSSQGLSRESVYAFISMQITDPPYYPVSASLPLELFSRSRQELIKFLYSYLILEVQSPRQECQRAHARILSASTTSVAGLAFTSLGKE